MSYTCQLCCPRGGCHDLSCAVDVKAKTKGFQVKQGGSDLVDLPKKEDVALFLHTSGTTSRPKVGSRS